MRGSKNWKTVVALSFAMAVAFLPQGARARQQTKNPVFDAVYLTTSDLAEAVDWYAEFMGGRKIDRPDRVAFGKTLIVFKQTDEPFEGSSGSSVDHIGFSATG